uniref:Uncharacterized protein n=1 Tax=Romanomermis culicivorax TaxID=13658 RepID=A0A915I717_ROMCU
MEITVGRFPQNCNYPFRPKWSCRLNIASCWRSVPFRPADKDNISRAGEHLFLSTYTLKHTWVIERGKRDGCFAQAYVTVLCPPGRVVSSYSLSLTNM